MKEIRSALRKLRGERPGRRFRSTRKEAEGATKGKLWRLVLPFLGLVLVTAGLFFLAVPGPGILILVLGFFLISLVSHRTARLLDRGEIRIRQAADWGRRRWSEAPPGIRALLVASGVVLAAAFSYTLLRGLELLQGK